MLALRRMMFAASIVIVTVLLHNPAARAAASATDVASSARATLWDDTDHDGVLGTAGDTRRARVTTTDGTFTLAAQGCTACGVVIDRVSGVRGALATRVSMRVDGAAMRTVGGLLWRDGDGNGAHGGASDALLGIATAVDGPLVVTTPICDACGLVVVDWVGSGQDIDWVGSGQDIDTISGSILDWGGSSQDIDWGGAGDEIDWRGSGDEIDWGGTGDEIDWGGTGDEIDWGGTGDEIDWGGAGDEIDWGGAGDEIDVALTRVR